MLEATTPSVPDDPALRKEMDRELDTGRQLKAALARRKVAASVHERIVRAWATLEKLSRRLMGSQSRVLPKAQSGRRGQLWQDPLTGHLYVRYPVTLTKHTTGAEVFDVLRYDHSDRASVELFAYDVPDGVELQFIPHFGLHFLIGNLVHLVGERGTTVPVVGGYSCRLEATDHFGVVHRGVIWSGTTDDINCSVKARLTGHPIVYNGETIVHVLGGDRFRLIAWIPKDAESVAFHPLSNPDRSFIEVRCYQLVRMRGGDDGPFLSDAEEPVKKRPTKKMKKPRASKKVRRKKRAR